MENEVAHEFWKVYQAILTSSFIMLEHVEEM